MTYIKALPHSSQLRTASSHHRFLLHTLGHGLTNLTHVKLSPCYTPIGYMSSSFPIKLCSATSILNTGWLCPDELQPCSEWILQFRDRQSGQHILAQEMGSSLRSLKQSRTGTTKASSIKNIIHCVPVIKQLCPGVS